MESFFNRRSTYTFIIILIITLGIIGTLLLVGEKQEPQVPAAPQPAVELIPAETAVDQGQEVGVDVMVRPAGESISRVELTLNFDKQYFGGISFTQAGSNFPNVILPGIVGNDTANIVLETNPAVPVTQDGVVARLILKARNPVSATSVSLNPQTKIMAISGQAVSAAFENTAITINRIVNPDSILYFSPSVVSVAEGGEFTSSVYINSGNNELSAVDVIILYDQDLLTGVVIADSTTLPTKLKSGAFVNGKASFSFGAAAGGANPAGTLKITDVTFRSKISGNTSLAFSHQSLVLDPRSDENMLKDKGALIVNAGGISTSPPPENGPLPTPGTGGACTYAAPLAPTAVTGESISQNQVRINWSKSAGATHYGLIYGTAPGSYKFGAANVGNVSTYTVGGLASGTTYYFSVFAVKVCQASGYSTQVKATTNKSSAALASPKPAASSTAYPQATFIPLDQSKDAIGFLTGPAASPNIEPVPIPTPEGFNFKNLTGGSPLLSPLGGILLIMAAIFAGIFFFRMRQ